MSNLFIPSYAQGFARNASESENPGLWTGLAGLWMPSLGPAGLTLRDWSGYGNHGTLTSMDPATDWVSTEKGWALDFDGSNDYVDFGNASILRERDTLTISMLYKKTGVIADLDTIIGRWDVGNDRRSWKIPDTNVFYVWTWVQLFSGNQNPLASLSYPD